MYVPRRHTRRLLLPPGWVALGFLLLLGCQALLAHRRQLRKESMMQLAMFPLKPDTAMARLMVKDYDMPYRSVCELDTARNWHTIDYWGLLLTDADNRPHIAAALQDINTDTAREGGVRIRLHEHATYAALIESLDIMNIYNQKKYFLDVRHQPITLYAITTKDIRQQTDANKSTSTYLGCCVCPSEPYVVLPPPPTFQQVINILWQEAWKLSIILLAAITLLSICHLGGPLRLAR